MKREGTMNVSKMVVKRQNSDIINLISNDIYIEVMIRKVECDKDY